ncbi:matrixin family metalloprotease [Cryptosporangium phraense]|uniref:Matrixin family metalloprotease n=1 Tax=Cryptosporangium phraense TaxID=2593070 RepID=A0A545AGP5_9ACTN|nr:matrixin family metalloprotease [Cryptosporangium phraense]TQS40506.1 matrixin family metalloprotease [Cryptosporangium phraense]
MRNLLNFRPASAPTAFAAIAAAAAVVAGIAAPVASITTAAPAAAPAGVKLVAGDNETALSAVRVDGADVKFQGLTVRIPAAGEGVQAAAESTSGELSITVSRSADGSVVVKTDKHEHAGSTAGPVEQHSAQAAAASTARAAAAKTCTDSAYALSGWKLPSFKWYYNPAGAPAAVRASAPAAISAATTSLTRACGQKAIKLAPSYGGATTAGVQVGAAGNCTGNDGRNVIGWRAGSGRWLGMTCTYFKTINGRKTVTGTDTALNTQYKFFTSAKSCSGAYDLQSVVLHERGHSLGLNHVSQASHASAVMTPALAPCSVGKRSLGLGDYRGLAATYGTR